MRGINTVDRNSGPGTSYEHNFAMFCKRKRHALRLKCTFVTSVHDS
jgi:hypothetical protein